MGIFKKKKLSLDEIQEAIQNHVQDSKSEDSLVFLRASGLGKKFQMVAGQVRARTDTLPRMLIEISKEDENFAKSLITASETLKTTNTDFNAFSKKLTGAVYSDPRIAEITKSLRDKSPGSEVQAIDLSKIDEMPKDEFDKMINNIFKASKDKNNGSESNKD